MPDTIDTPFWNDRVKGPGKTRRPLTAAAVVLADLGPQPMLEVPSTANALHLRLVAVVSGQEVAVPGYDRVDANAPFRVGPGDAKTFDVPPGAYRLTATPVGTDGKPTGVARTFDVVVAGRPAAPATANLVGVLFNDADGDGVLDPSDRPTGVRGVELDNDVMQPLGVQSNAAGAYAYTGLPAGDYKVRRGGFPKGYRCSNANVDADGWIPVRLSAGQTAVVNIGTTAVKTDGDPAPTPPQDADPAAAKLSGKMRVGLDDLAHVAYATVRSLIDPLRLRSLRVWWHPYGYAKGYARDKEVANALTFARQGYDVIYTVAQDGLTPALAKGAPEYAVKMVGDLIAVYDADPQTKGRVIRYQHGNEPDLRYTDKTGKLVLKYWTGTIAEYVASLKATFDALKAVFGDRVQVIAAGFSHDIKAMTAFGAAMAAACDAFAFHGYPNSLSKADLQRYVDLVALAKKYGKLAIVTEGSMGYGDDFRNGTKTLVEWAADNVRLMAFAESAGVDEWLIFNARDINTENSAGALLDDAWKPRPLYHALKEAVAA